jgi:hypothetical protein
MLSPAGIWDLLHQQISSETSLSICSAPSAILSMRGCYAVFWSAAIWLPVLDTKRNKACLMLNACTNNACLFLLSLGCCYIASLIWEILWTMTWLFFWTVSSGREALPHLWLVVYLNFSSLKSLKILSPKFLVPILISITSVLYWLSSSLLQSYLCWSFSLLVGPLYWLPMYFNLVSLSPNASCTYFSLWCLLLPTVLLSLGCC